MTTPPANWYPDPDRPGWLRYWDGRQWTAHTGPAPAPEPQPRATDFGAPGTSRVPYVAGSPRTDAPSAWPANSAVGAGGGPGRAGGGPGRAGGGGPGPQRGRKPGLLAGMSTGRKVLVGSVAGIFALAAIGSAIGDDSRTSAAPSAATTSGTTPAGRSTGDAAGLAGAGAGQGGDSAGDAGGDAETATESATTPAGPTLYQVTAVIDGDTIKVRIKGTTYRVRVLGIDTPELSAKACYAQKAASRMQSLVQSKSVALRRDSRQPDRDQYGRLVRHVLLADGSYAGYALLKGGFAKEYVPRGDYAGRATFLKAQAYAKAKKIGVWSAACAVPKPTSPAPFVSPPKQPTTPRPPAPKPPVAPPPTSTTCDIKGNISSSGEKIYHVPGQRFYNATVITLSKGERWFCSESAAVAAGWRKAKV